MFVWAPIPEPYREMGSLEFASFLVEEAKVATSPGVGFGPDRRRLRALRPHRERAAHRPGRPQHAKSAHQAVDAAVLVFRNDTGSFRKVTLMDAAAIHARRWWTLAVMCLSLMVIGVDNTILNVALPTLVRDLDATTSSSSGSSTPTRWSSPASCSPPAASATASAAGGALTLGLLVFGAGSVASALAGSADQLIATRALMGVGGALIMPATLSIISNVFTVPAERARAIAVWAGFSAMGIAIGPLSGGWLLEHFWWGSVFMVNIPIVVLALVGGRLFVPESKDPSPRGLDPVGALLSIVGLSPWCGPSSRHRSRAGPTRRR